MKRASLLLASNAPPATSGTSGVRSKGPRDGTPLVLLIDDVDDSREMYATYLQIAGLRVAEARDGQEGVRLCAELLPDVVVMDMQMPVLDGWKAIRLLKARDETKDIPVIALTGVAERDRLRMAYQAGASELLIKPCRSEVLQSAILAVLQRTSARRR